LVGEHGNSALRDGVHKAGAEYGGHMGKYGGHIGKYGGHMGKYGGHMGISLELHFRTYGKIRRTYGKIWRTYGNFT
jgi:hypothetical protein